MSANPFKAILEFIAKDQIEPAILAQNDYLLAENRILLGIINSGEKLCNEDRKTLAELGFKLKEINKQLFEQSVQIVKPETVLQWHRKLVAKKFDGSKNRKPSTAKQKRITKEIEAEIVRIAKEDERAGYGKIVGYLEDLGINFSKTTIAKILKKYGVKPAPERKNDLTWSKFIESHKEVLWGCDFFTQEVWTLQGLMTYYVLVFIHLGSRRLEIINMTQNPTGAWATQQARNFVYDKDQVFEKEKMRYLIRDRGSQYIEDFDNVFKGEGVKIIKSKYPQMNAYTERVIQSIQNECTDRMIFLGERSLRYALKQYQAFHNTERHHQGIGNKVPFPVEFKKPSEGEIECKTRLGGLLRQYRRKVAA